MDLPTEHQEQAAFFEWFGLQYPDVLAFAIPNGGLRNKITAKKLKAEGVKPGIPDIMIAAPRHGYNGLFIEMKRKKTGRVTKDQGEIIEKLKDEGYMAWVCFGFEAAKYTTQEYLK